MKRTCSFLFFLLTSLVLFAAPAPKLSYTISPSKAGDYTSFSITMTVKGGATGKTILSIPYETGLYRPQDQFALLRVTNSQKHQAVPGDSTLYSIEHKPNALLTITYTIKNALKDTVPTGEEVYAQMLTDKYFYLIGSSLWVTPQDSTGTPYDIGLHWKGFPSSWKLLNTYGANEANQRIRIPLSEFKEAMYMGGDIRIHKLMINERPLYFGIRGQWSFSDDQVFDVIKKTVRAQRGYWNDYDVDRYTIGLIPMKYHTEGERSINGRALSNTFVTVGTNSKAFGLADLAYLYNHELMHHWLGHVLKQRQPENMFKWFHEGFTDYFAHVVMLEGGLLNEQEYRQRINTIFAGYYKDSTHQWPNEKLAQDYWASDEMQKLPYQRGLLFALYLNESLAFYSKGAYTLKGVVNQLLSEARQQQKPFSQERFLALLQKGTGKDYTALFDRFITHGSFISIADWKAVSNKVALLPIELYDLGFTTDIGIALNARITAVDEGSNAQKAGLRVGDILAGFSSTYQPTDSASVAVKRGDEKIKLRYLPSRHIMVPQLQ